MVESSIDGEGTDAAVAADAGLAQQLREGLDDGVRTDLDAGVDHDRLGLENRDAGRHEPLRCGEPQFAVQHHHLGDCIGAQNLFRVRGLDGQHALAGVVEDAGHVGQIQFCRAGCRRSVGRWT